CSLSGITARGLRPRQGKWRHAGPGRLGPVASGVRGDAEQLDLEDERGAGRDHPAGPALAVPQVSGDDELALAADLHRRHALVPAADHTAPADGELERLTAIERAVELRPVLEPPGVVHADRIAGGRPHALPV